MVMVTRTHDQGVPPDYDPSAFPAFAVTVDVVILTMCEGTLCVLLVRRGVAPFEGMWAIPGGFKRPTETLDEAAKRELSEETGVDSEGLLTQFGAYGDPGRDPRMSVVTVAYLAVLRDLGSIVAGTDAAVAALVPVTLALDGETELAFDHARIVRDAVDRVRVDLELKGIATAFLGTDLHARRTASRVRGRVGRAPRRRQLPAEPPRGGRLGDPDGAPSAAGRDRRQAGGALSGRPHVEARRADQAPASN